MTESEKKARELLNKLRKKKVNIQIEQAREYITRAIRNNHKIEELKKRKQRVYIRKFETDGKGINNLSDFYKDMQSMDDRYKELTNSFKDVFADFWRNVTGEEISDKLDNVTDEELEKLVKEHPVMGQVFNDFTNSPPTAKYEEVVGGDSSLTSTMVTEDFIQDLNDLIAKKG